MRELEEPVTPILDEHTIDFISHSTEQTRRLGARLGQLFVGGEVLCLIGELGTGKTCLVQGIGRGLGVADQITSPTFTLVQTYETPEFALWHYDLYRLNSPDELHDLAIDEALQQGVCVIEWPEIAMSLLPQDRLDIHLASAASEDQRSVTMEGSYQWQQRWQQRKTQA